jgi:light-harvesting complex I chlorophyll a/b binding protein 2
MSKVAVAAKGDITVSATIAEKTVPANRPLWLPGAETPEYLDGTYPADFGFDPLGLSANPDLRKWYRQAEIVHCRWAMLGAAGIFIPELLTKLGILNTPSWITAGVQPYFLDTSILILVEVLAMGWVETRRWGEIADDKPWGQEIGYPGGKFFDPLNFASGSEEKIKDLRTREIKNGRLAMLAVLGAFVQANVTHTGPIDNLFAHISDPYHINVAQAIFGK